VSEPRYDAIAGWYDAEFATSEGGLAARKIVLRLLGKGPGRLLDVGCGGGAHAEEFAEHDWTVTGVDISPSQLELARRRGIDVVEADAAALPFKDAVFDAVVSMFLHTDVEDFAAVLREVARVLTSEGRFVYLGTHPCFAGPHARFDADRKVPELHPGYRDTSYRTDAPGIWGDGVRAKVGATHLPIGLFVQAVLDAGLVLEQFEEPEGREYPYIIALRARR
jgi:ubiquinone/menaquinone biosynthesis C-methylase UbiE